MPDVSQISMKVPRIALLVFSIIGGVWWFSGALTDLKRDVEDLQGKGGNLWSIADQERWCWETMKLTPNFRCYDPQKIAAKRRKALNAEYDKGDANGE